MKNIGRAKRLLAFISYNKNRLAASFGKEKDYIKRELLRAEQELLKLSKEHKHVKDFLKKLV